MIPCRFKVSNIKKFHQATVEIQIESKIIVMNDSIIIPERHPLDNTSEHFELCRTLTIRYFPILGRHAWTFPGCRKSTHKLPIPNNYAQFYLEYAQIDHRWIMAQFYHIIMIQIVPAERMNDIIIPSYDTYFIWWIYHSVTLPLWFADCIPLAVLCGLRVLMSCCSSVVRLKIMCRWYWTLRGSGSGERRKGPAVG